MAAKLLEIPHEVEGVVVECGCFLGGSTANLSLACEAVGRDLIAYDSFEGLPSPREGDKYGRAEAGFLRGDLDVVKENVRRFGAIDRCTFRKGWYSDTLPAHTEPVVLLFLDVDYQASLDACVLVRALLAHSLRRHASRVDRRGLRVGVGQYYLGPVEEWVAPQDPASVAYTRKDFSGRWDYYPEGS